LTVSPPVAQYQPIVHRLALLMALVSLAPIGLGALVTTKDAGMAFRDWPTSDGQGMFAYPWLRATGEKFLEHAHRLAGVLIGCATMAFCAAVWLRDVRTWARCLAAVVLLAVVAQGILGGMRVLQDEKGLAFLHGSLASLVFALMCALCTITSREWLQAGPRAAAEVPAVPLVASLGASVALFIQYLLGGLLRHQGRVLFEHLGFAFVAALVVIWLSLSTATSGLRWLNRLGAALGCLMLLQLGLGAGAWITRFGLGSYVAVYGSAAQVLFRTSHVLSGLFLFAACVVLAVRIARLRSLALASRKAMHGQPMTPGFSGTLTAAGGAS
jgi:cytochrome c oxidase assembly protein subunit 15